MNNIFKLVKVNLLEIFYNSRKKNKAGGGAGQAARRALSTWSLPRFTRGYCFFCDAPLAQYRRITALLAMRPIPDDPYDGTRFQARRASRCAVLHLPQREARPLGKQA